jgi:4'-phosphopantetheinyl transferase
MSPLDQSIHLWHTTVVADRHRASSIRWQLTKDELDRADRFKFEDLQWRFAQRRALLRQILAIYVDVPPEELRFRYNARGKPFLESTSNERGIEFSMSHSKDRMIVAVTLGRDIGADIEVHRDNIDKQGLAEHFFAPKDIEVIRNARDEESLTHEFFRTWTGKEAYVKAIGDGLLIPLDQFHINTYAKPVRLEFASHRFTDPKHADLSRWNFEWRSFSEDESICIAYFGPPATIEVRETS